MSPRFFNRGKSRHPNYSIFKYLWVALRAFHVFIDLATPFNSLCSNNCLLFKRIYRASIPGKYSVISPLAPIA